MFDTRGRIKCGTIAAPDFNGSLADWTNVPGLECVAVRDPDGNIAEFYQAARRC